LWDIITTENTDLDVSGNLMHPEQKDTYHLAVLWMACYGVDQWETELPFCEIFTVAFFL
jgi:hypothetical protein